MRKDWSAVGWQGVSTLVPSDWSLVGVSGDRSRGYFRADGPGVGAVEVRWAAQASSPDLESRAEQYLKNLERTAKKRKFRFTSKIKPRKPTPAETRNGGSSVGFTWRGDRSAYGRVLWCGDCKRVVIAQVVGPLDEDLSGVSAEILGALCSHEEPGWSLWGLYGMAAFVPDSYRLMRHTLMSSYVRLVFKGRAGELTVERWGLAGSLVRDKGLSGWYNREYRPENTGFVLTEVMSRWDDHEELSISGKRKLLPRLTALPRKLIGRGQPSNLTASVRFCPESNRIYGVRLLHRRDDAILREVVNRLKCH